MRRGMQRGSVAVAVLVVLALLAAACTGGSSASTSSNGSVTIEVWHGYSGPEGTEMTKLIKRYEALHPNVHIQPTFIANLDYALQKVETAIAGGQPPDISYLYGSWAANIAESPSTVVLNSRINSDPSFDWNDFWPGERSVATVNGNIVGIPALVDNLALVYNKKLFEQAGMPFPTASWTWEDFARAAVALTNPARKQFGWAYVADGSEDTVWRFIALLWQAGGSLLTPDGKHAAFDSPAGIAAMTLLDRLSAAHAIYFDNGNGNYLGLFNTNHIAMLYTGPWDLSSITTQYGVTILPALVNHQSISGPDNWVMFNNGAAREQAAWNFLSWLTAPAQDADWIVHTCDLPIRQSVVKIEPAYTQFLKNCPGDGVFVENLGNVHNARPSIVAYPKISQAIGTAVVSVLLQKATPAQALSSAAAQTNQILAVP